jgi:ABC-type branched-subunit amino acid transport system ATPase component
VRHALAIADDVVVLVKGEIAFNGPASEVGNLHEHLLGTE